MKNKLELKISTLILSTLLAVLVIGVFASNLVLKNVYDQVDKSDVYWNYNTILNQPYKHVKLEGTNLTGVIFEPSKHASVRVLNYWWGYQKDSSVRAYVKNDTLYVTFPKLKNPNDRYWMQGKILVRLFAPELLSIDGNNSNIEVNKLKQRNLAISMTGKSTVKVESYSHNFDTLNVSQADSSQVVLRMSPDLKGSNTLNIAHVNANLKGYTILDIGHGYAGNLKLNLADSSAITLSGKSLGRLNK